MYSTQEFISPVFPAVSVLSLITGLSYFVTLQCVTCSPLNILNGLSTRDWPFRELQGGKRETTICHVGPVAGENVRGERVTIKSYGTISSTRSARVPICFQYRYWK